MSSDPIKNYDSSGTDLAEEDNNRIAALTASTSLKYMISEVGSYIRSCNTGTSIDWYDEVLVLHWQVS